MTNGNIDPNHQTEICLTDAPVLVPNPLQGRFFLSDNSEVGLLRTLANGTYLIDFATEKLHKFADN
jgi:hypothetical protein